MWVAHLKCDFLVRVLTMNIGNAKQMLHHSYWTLPAAEAGLSQTSALNLSQFGGLLFILSFSCHLPLSLLQALHLTSMQLGQILLLHMHTAELGPKSIVGNVLFLLEL